MMRLVAPGNLTSGLDRLPEGPPPSVGQAEVDELVGGSLPDVDVVVVGGEPSPDLIEPHRRAENLVVVSAAPVDVHLGQRGALAGLGSPWSVRRSSLTGLRIAAGTTETELRWLLWNDGAVVLPVRDAPIAGAEVDPFAAEVVPLRGTRPPSRTQATVPTVSWIVHGEGSLVEAFEHIDRAPPVPDEILVVGEWDELPRPGRRIHVVSSADEALEAASGAIIWFLEARADPDRECLARMLRRFQDERIEVVRTAYASDDGPIRSTAGLARADGGGLPWCVAVRRRPLRKERVGMIEAWHRTAERERGALLLSDPVPIPARGVSRAPGLGDLARLDRSDIQRVLRPAPESTRDQVPTPTVSYVGFTGYGNFGDELMLRAARTLLDGVEVSPGIGDADAVVLGGGTLLNADGFFLRIVERVLRPGSPRLVLGTGVVDPSLAGWTENLDDWRFFLEAALPVGVRGPRSLEHLRAWGWDGPAEILGDPGLIVEPPPGGGDGVVIAPVGESSVGQIDSADSRRQVDLLADAVTAWRSEGRPVTLLSCHAGDDRIIVDLLRRTGRTEIDHVTAHRDLDAGLRAIGSASLVVGTRLHALVAAAAAGVPFAGIAYRPKVFDFAESLGVGDWAAGPAAWTVERLLGMTGIEHEAVETMRSGVADLRTRLRHRARQFTEQLTAG